MQQIMKTYLQSNPNPNPNALLFLQHHIPSLTFFLYLLTSKFHKGIHIQQTILWCIKAATLCQLYA